MLGAAIDDVGNWVAACLDKGEVVEAHGIFAAGAVDELVLTVIRGFGLRPTRSVDGSEMR